MLKTKLAIALTLCPTLTIGAAHYASHCYINFETHALSYLAAQKNQALEALASYSGQAKELAAKNYTIQDVINQAATQNNLKPELIEAVITVESNWKPNAIRYEAHLAKGSTDQDRMNASSHGLMQILPFWCGKDLCPNVKNWSDLYNPVKNIQCGTAILAQALKESGSVRKALITYNGGSKCPSNPSCLAQAETHATKVMQALAERMVNPKG